VITAPAGVQQLDTDSKQSFAERVRELVKRSTVSLEICWTASEFVSLLRQTFTIAATSAELDQRAALLQLPSMSALFDGDEKVSVAASAAMTSFRCHV